MNTLEYATNLTYLAIRFNNVSNITAVSELTNLTELIFEHNNIADISPVEKLTNLTSLGLSENNISDISAVAGLTNLTSLGLSGNAISDISIVAGLTNLTYLDLDYNSISDISTVAGLTNLTVLSLDRNPIADISPVEKLTNLTSLGLSGNAISDISIVAGLTNLTYLGLSGNSISDITAVAGITNLTYLDLRYNAIEDLSPLVANTGLGSGDEVILDGNPLNAESIDTHIPALRSRGVVVSADNLITGQVVDIPDSNLRTAIERALGIAPGGTITAGQMATLIVLLPLRSDISNLTGLEYATNLTILDLGQNNIPDIYPVSGLTNLTILDLAENNISDISAVSGLTDLTFLNLADNSIEDLSPLVANTGLGTGDEVFVDRNPLNAASVDTHIPALESRGVEVSAEDLITVQAEELGIYWIDRGTNSIRAASFDGSRNEGVITSGLESLNGLALDEDGEQIYWTQWRAKVIQRANLDGSNVEDLVTQGLKYPRDIALDATGGKMYWTDSGTDKIQRANLDGSNVEDLVTHGLRVPIGLALDSAAGKMYWVDSGTDKIQRAGLDGSSVEDLVTGGLKFPIDIALDVTGGKMYWTDVGTGTIQRANLDGSSIEDIAIGLSGPHSIALDAAGGVMYWTDWRAKTIQRADLDGSNVVTVVSDGVDSPSSIAIVSGVEAPIVSPEDDTEDAPEDDFQVEDANRDGAVDVHDIVYIGERFGQTGESSADVNGDEIVNVADILLVAAALIDNVAAAPAAVRAQLPDDITAATIQQWLDEAELTGEMTPVYQRGIFMLEQLLAALTPETTVLLANYPNPFNPETWIPYELATGAEVSLNIYDMDGSLVRRIDAGYKAADAYQKKADAIYWDGRNADGEPVSSGVYFYTLTAGDYTASRKMVILK